MTSEGTLSGFQYFFLQPASTYHQGSAQYQHVKHVITIDQINKMDVRVRLYYTNDMNCYFQMGYANPGQTSHGIHMRQMSRAFVFATSPSSPRVVYVTLEAGWAGGAVKREVCTL